METDFFFPKTLTFNSWAQQFLFYPRERNAVWTIFASYLELISNFNFKKTLKSKAKISIRPVPK